MLGPIRQELLSGIRQQQQFERIHDQLESFPDLVLAQHDWETAARFFNTCRNHGIQGSNIDFLICAAAVNHNMEIWSTDKDFDGYVRYLPIKMYQVP